MSAILAAPTPAKLETASITVSALREADLTGAEGIFRLAFGTFLGSSQPETFWSDRDYVRARWSTDPMSAFGAGRNGRLVGSNFAVSWGSVGFLGPLTIHPQFWDQGIGGQLVDAVINRLDQLNTTHVGLFTFAQSSKHVGLYQKFGFWPRFLSAIMSTSVEPTRNAPRAWRFSQIAETEKGLWLAECRDLTSKIYDGLDLSSEIHQLCKQQRGDTVFLRDESSLNGFAVCHYGPASEAGADACLIKFAAIRPGPTAQQSFDDMLAACKMLATEAGMQRLFAGVNTGCGDAYRHLLARNFQIEMQGVNMHRPNDAGYYRADLFLLDDWR
jgi:N-acetylglutamate synthase-like GNAT family acetyltransferase